jgi:uncharacterized membrane protein (DUF4010 family)
MTALRRRRESPSSASQLNRVVTILTFLLGILAGAGQLAMVACSALALMLALKMPSRRVA